MFFLAYGDCEHSKFLLILDKPAMSSFNSLNFEVVGGHVFLACLNKNILVGEDLHFVEPIDGSLELIDQILG